MYSQNSEFFELVTAIAVRHKHATLDEIHLAIEAVVKFEDELQKLAILKYEVRDWDVFKQVISEAMTELEEIHNADTEELQVNLRDICALKAEKAFHQLRMAFLLEELEPEESFAGTVYKAKKIRKGPITIEQRKTFKRLSERLAELDEERRRLDEELEASGVLTPKQAEEIVEAFYNVLLAQEETRLMDADDLPYSRETILEAGDVLTVYLTKLQESDPHEFARLKCEVLLNAAQSLFGPLMLFYDIDAEDKETVADLNKNWREVENRIKNEEATEADQDWMSNAMRVVIKYQFR